MRRIDREMRGIRLTIRTGGLSAELHHGLSGMLTHLKRTGNIGLWNALKEADIDVLTLYQRYRTGQLEHVIIADAVRTARTVMLEWSDSRTNPTTRKSYRECINNLFRNHPTATIDRLPEVLAEVRKHYERKGQKNTFDQCRKVSSSWAGKTYGRDSVLWRRLRAVPPIEASAHVHRQEARSVWDVISSVKQMQSPFGEMFWTMCLLGTGTKEYLSDGFTVFPNQWVVIHGRKNRARERRIPLVFSGLVQPAVSLVNRKAFDRALHAVQPDWDLYDARRTYSHWCEEASIPATRVQAYMGHDPRTVNEKYRRHSVDPYLVHDASRLRNYIESHRTKPIVTEPLETVPEFAFD